MPVPSTSPPRERGDVRKGTRQDALWFALGANRTNGKRLERGDVRKAVEVALREWPNKVLSEIAKQVGCTHRYVKTVQDELCTSTKLTLPATRTGKDGKDRPTTYATRRDSVSYAESYHAGTRPTPRKRALRDPRAETSALDCNG